MAEKAGKYKYVLLVLAVGLVLILLPTGGDRSGSSPADGDTEAVLPFELEETESRIAAALAEIDGAGRVTVVLTVKSGTEQVIAYNTDERIKTGSDGAGTDTERTTDAVIVSRGSSVQDPVTLKYIYPEYLGALVVSEGAGNAEVRLELSRAVSALTGLKSDKITITKMKDN